MKSHLDRHVPIYCRAKLSRPDSQIFMLGLCKLCQIFMLVIVPTYHFISVRQIHYFTVTGQVITAFLCQVQALRSHRTCDTRSRQRSRFGMVTTRFWYKILGDPRVVLGTISTHLVKLTLLVTCQLYLPIEKNVKIMYLIFPG